MILHRWMILFVISILFALGLVMIFNTTSAEVLDHSLSQSTHYALLKQIAFAVVSVSLALIVRKVGYKRLLELSPLLLFIFTCLLLVCLIPGIGREVNGSKRWISLAGFSLQPSEFVKYLIPVFLVYRFSKIDPSTLTLKTFALLLGILLVPIALILVEPNNGTVGVILMSLIGLCFLLRIPARFWAWPLAAALAVGCIAAYQLPYVRGRLKVYWNPELDLRGKGHQPYQAKIAAGSGGLMGNGPGSSLQKFSYLPEAQNDYIAAIYAEEFGFVGMMSLIFLYMLLAYTGLAIAMSHQDPQAAYIAMSVTFLISLQAFMNLGVVSGLLPSTGLNLPFFSQGGSSLMANMIGIGILVNLCEESTWTRKKR